MTDLQIFLTIVGVWYGLVIILRLTRTFKKTRCPKCNGRLTRKSRSLGDRFLRALTLDILPLRRYRCVHCNWQGLRWKYYKQMKKEPRP